MTLGANKNKKSLGRYILDTEANGLLDEVTVMHCAVLVDMDTEETFEFVGWSKELEEFLDKASVLCCHNGTGYDMPMLKKLQYWEPSPHTKVWDTLVLSRLEDPDRPRVEGCKGGPHSVEAWGMRLGRWKPDHTDWSTYTPEMLHRCSEDTHIQLLILKELMLKMGCTKGISDPFSSSCYGEMDWSRAVFLEHESAKIMFKQAESGVYFDTDIANKHLDTLTSIIETEEAHLHRHMSKRCIKKGVSISAPFKANGDMKKTVYDWFGPDTHYVGGPFTRIVWEELNIGSTTQIKEWLYTVGWEPDEWNEVEKDGMVFRTSPKLSETSLVKVKDGLGDSLILRNKARHRRSNIEGLLKRVRDDHRIPAAANSLGTPTGRMRHIGVANVPSASVYENDDDENDPRNGELLYYPEKQDPFFGTEMRDLYCAPPSRVLVGRDASGLELRCFAHYLNNPDYTRALLESDIHTYNQHLAGLPSRSLAKRFIYAFLYGAGKTKLGELFVPAGTDDEKLREGTEAYQTFLESTDGLTALIKGVQAASGRGYLKGLDGRALRMRRQHGKIQKSKALNTLLQGAGAQIMTYARYWLASHPTVVDWVESGKAVKVLDYHDEETYECDEDIAEELRTIMIESVREAGRYFNLRCELDAEARIGKTWAEIH